ncbi:protein of unknown function [Trichlorobacter ammonificans]|uniref:Uncharacterized protein n=1 Tax=Trichlorobacter ammonificans TaxID=2916410 RepID=A0ABN8HFT6_9BACT|nr:protein of unknown function [Trichlorobacter ammonificans]
MSDPTGGYFLSNMRANIFQAGHILHNKLANAHLMRTLAGQNFHCGNLFMIKFRSKVHNFYSLKCYVLTHSFGGFFKNQTILTHCAIASFLALRYE